ncbi:MAG: peptidase M14 [Phyllobacteriaceae bacterium]|nr:peptidase M14 [Phyllobacteriaceae bacterium]
MKLHALLFCLFSTFILAAQQKAPVLSELKLEQVPAGKVSHYWLQMGEDAFGQAILVPVIVAKGNEGGPALGLTAAIHGNELNGIAVIHEALARLDLATLKGSVIAIPGLNPPAIFRNQREFPDGQDLNRIFPGKANGNESQQFTYAIATRILPLFDILLDLHTASFGRENTLYCRADTSDQLLFALARLQQPDIILHSEGQPSAGATASGRTLRAEAIRQGIPCITIEYGNPQVWQADMIDRGAAGILRTLSFLGMQPPRNEQPAPEPVICRKSYWIYTDRGGLLHVPVEKGQKVSKGELIGVLKNPFGEIICTYHAPEDGIIIGKSTNPAGGNGARIVHLGVERE